MTQIEKDELSGTDTTGHVWDGIKELNSPLPRWWLWTFYITVIWAAGYCIAYPAIPLITDSTKGLLGYSSRAEVVEELKLADDAKKSFLEQIEKLPLAEIRKNSDLLEFAVAGGRSAYLVNCVQCHGSGAAGSKGYPNLNDDEWLWGGSLDDIFLTIRHGIRFEQDEDTRLSDMPAFGTDEILDKNQINDVAEYTLSLSNNETDGEAAKRGAPIYEENCVSCHAEGGVGNRELGAPPLNNAITLYGNSKEEIVETIANARNSVMPAWGQRLDLETIKKLTLYVHSLGGGEQETAALNAN